MNKPKENTLDTLNNTLFDTLAALSNKDLKGDALKDELSKAKAIKDISHQIVSSAALSLKAAEFAELNMKHKMVPGKENPLRKETVSVLPETIPKLLAIGPSGRGDEQ